ncbi:MULTISPECIES: helix-turn-helix transcriptional regulator [Bradyrhizobium]|jgi:LuxR family transcriptional regulator, quorum-sensing system regulator BjaR1|uniref:helix-turn-helix transcriptional regulator n=1 Tax=Bradyrhizobium TaxID=374 RepID=UPI000480A443|nr:MULTISPECIES: LuxR family transcriptional regulator [Bradyrhizobium]MCS3446351.1 LuxR family quorum sensing-dependent transcriptional regulator [Bradyrhizobium elkanii]MCS3562516.1 LuxR family quorum sensing-dependent transcriptional regulator [Bradyrhizobium elkanii]MCW2147647.1 LuxR family quorum sensing-dependent transcriptional regulator [Bradyrhizobium elkanii]MCW2353268.1 LuxR family quorum sensing-dependent transcriptional regulator [Bradyrhizobium elkanii]MCW2371374.1 LuxR family qu
MGLVDAISTIEASDTIDELSSSLHRVVQNYGFSGFAFVDAGRPDLDLPYHTGTFPDAWKRAYVQNEFVHADPALARSRRTNTPFSWSSLKLPERSGRRRPPEVKTMDAAREFGFKDGFVVPFHYRDRLGAVHSSSTVFFWEDEPRDFDKLFVCHRHELHLLMIYWVQRAMDIVNRDQRNAPTILKPADAAETIKLTGREKEVIAWAARGKTVADTAQILGISPETVEGFIKQALRKLEASNKTHGVAKSIALGIIDL